MTRRLLFAGLFFLCSGTSTLLAQTVSLAESKKNAYFHIKLQMNVTGVMKLRQDGKDTAIQMKGVANHSFLERILDSDDRGIKRSARHYQTARATFTVAKDSLQRELRSSHQLIAAQRVLDQTVTFSPKGPLTREELELTEHLDTMALPGLLPGRKVSVGDSWKINSGVVQSMCGLDGLTGHDLKAKLAKASDAAATISITGTANGIDMGAAVKLSVKAELQFDRTRECITSVVWNQDDEREQGPVNPALSAKVVVTMTREPSAPAKELNDFAIVPIPSETVPPPALTELHYRDAKGRFALQHEREWHLVAHTEKHTVFRLMDRGDFVAQATVTPWTKAKAGAHMSANDFREAMEQIPGWEAQETLDKGSEVKSKKGYWVYRVGASGKMEGVDAIQYFYLTAGPQGNQFVVTFTTTPSQAQKLNTRDLTFVRSLTIRAK